MKTLFKNLFSQDRVLIGLLILLSALAAHSLLQGGHPRIGDCWAHLARTGVVVDALKSFQLPYWDFRIYYGYPFLKFYAPLYYYIAAVFALVTGDLVFGTKLLLFLAHVLSALAMFIFVRKFLNDSRAAFVAGLAYAFSFWHLFHILAMSRYPAALIYVAVPLCFWATISYLENQTFRRALVLGLIFGGTLLIHPQYGFFAIFFSGLFAAPFLGKIKYKTAVWALVAMVAISGHSILPFFIESGRYLNPFSSENYYNVSLAAILERAKYINRYSNWYLGEYIGLSLVLVAILGMIKLFKDSKAFRWQIGAGLLFCIVFTFGLTITNFEWFYHLTGMIPKRHLVFLIIFLSILAANGYLFLVNFIKRPILILAGISLIILIDLGPTCFQVRWYPPKDIVMKKRDSAYASIQPGYFLADLGRAETNIFENARLMYPGMQSLYSHNPTPFGYFFQFASKTTYYSYPWLNIVAGSVGMPVGDSLKALDDKIAQLLNIKYVVLESAADDSLADSTRMSNTVLTGTVPSLNPIIISPSIRTWPESPVVIDGQYCFAGDYQELLNSYQINLDLSAARILWVRNAMAENISSFIPSRPLVYQFNLGINQAEMVVETKSECFARIPLSYYPDIKIYINGERTREIYESADHFIVVRLEPGLNIIKIVPTRSYVEIAALLLSGLCLIAVNVALYRERKTRKTK
jgi:hypothetical protein